MLGDCAVLDGCVLVYFQPEQVHSAVTRQVLPNAVANVRTSGLVFKPVSPPWICMTADVIDALNSVSFIVDTIRA